ncbi:unnamed protein product, partial [Enterobius vermicularis]|uniref:AAA_28 domain-containing protein n=1 Tax=Enterobius vermicularis TaxID=51028 RepID=A0A0N4VMD6_ENTVE
KKTKVTNGSILFSLPKGQEKRNSVPQKRLSSGSNEDKPRIYKVVLTGGPCGGKTTGQSRLRTFFENMGWKVYTVSETATILLGGGVKFEELSYEQAYQFQKDVVATLLQIESVFFKQAEMSSKAPVLIICDRGAMDPSAYIDHNSWEKMLTELGEDQFSMREGRYDQVIHLTTAADGAEAYYTLANNQARKESLEAAIIQDQKTRDAWLGHPRVDVIDNTECKSFEDKMLKLIAAVCDRAGITSVSDRLSFDSKKRKWLVKSLDRAAMPRCETFTVRHHYLRSSQPDLQLRLRSRSQNGRTTYTFTTRYLYPEPLETKMQLSEREYQHYLKIMDHSRAPINKQRMLNVVFIFQYFHIDIYTEPLPPACEGKSLMILETYTTAPVGDTTRPELPSFAEIEKEITGDLKYSMYNIAVKSVNSSRKKEHLLNGDQEVR